ncbi:hypothetical protein BGX27_004849 [Mortierella sp. AM989]|nr:hypothetical protein BGX27_004849 [Mortierella sp. AM989]
MSGNQVEFIPLLELKFDSYGVNVRGEVGLQRPAFPRNDRSKGYAMRFSMTDPDTENKRWVYLTAPKVSDFPVMKRGYVLELTNANFTYEEENGWEIRASYSMGCTWSACPGEFN